MLLTLIKKREILKLDITKFQQIQCHNFYLPILITTEIVRRQKDIFKPKVILNNTNDNNYENDVIIEELKKSKEEIVHHEETEIDVFDEVSNDKFEDKKKEKNDMKVEQTNNNDKIMNETEATLSISGNFTHGKDIIYDTKLTPIELTMKIDPGTQREKFLIDREIKRIQSKNFHSTPLSTTFADTCNIFNQQVKVSSARKKLTFFDEEESEDLEMKVLLSFKKRYQPTLEELGRIKKLDFVPMNVCYIN
jgi:hypothetical protein